MSKLAKLYDAIHGPIIKEEPIYRPVPDFSRPQWLAMFLALDSYMRRPNFVPLRDIPDGPFTPTTGLRLPDEIHLRKMPDGSVRPYPLDECVAIELHEEANGEDDDYPVQHAGSRHCPKCPEEYRMYKMIGPYNYERLYKELSLIRGSTDPDVWDEADYVIAKYHDVRRLDPSLTGLQAVRSVDNQVLCSSMMSDAAIVCLKRMCCINEAENAPRTGLVEPEVNGLELHDNSSNPDPDDSEENDDNVSVSSTASTASGYHSPDELLPNEDEGPVLDQELDYDPNSDDNEAARAVDNETDA